MKERGILYTGEMIREILAGNKSQTRRLRGLEEAQTYCPNHLPWKVKHEGGVTWSIVGTGTNGRKLTLRCPFGEVGDHLWCRETWAALIDEDTLRIKGAPLQSDTIVYRATRADSEWDEGSGFSWRPSLFMPRWASRITTEITNIRLERLTSISASDAIGEGKDAIMSILLDTKHPLRRAAYERGDADGYAVDGPYAGAVHAYAALWDSINGAKAPWDSRPWVWAISFRRIESAAKEVA